MEPIDRQLQKERKIKLTQANFTLGASPQFYGTTNKGAFVPKRASPYSLDQRKMKVDTNRRTNFISQTDGGFEAQPKKFDFGTVPDKGVTDTSKVNDMIADLKREHFRIGNEVRPMMRASDNVGRAAHSAKKPEMVPWASMKTNYQLGTDQDPKTTDYQNRFATTQ